MRILHLAIGAFGVIIFLFSGYYMLETVPHLPDGERMAWRANHIYLMMIAVAHLLLGGYYRDTINAITRSMQTIGSVLMFGASILAILAFFLEAGSSSFDERIYSFIAALCIFSGAIFHSISTWLDSYISDQQKTT